MIEHLSEPMKDYIESESIKRGISRTELIEDALRYYRSLDTIKEILWEMDKAIVMVDDIHTSLCKKKERLTALLNKEEEIDR